MHLTVSIVLLSRDIPRLIQHFLSEEHLGAFGVCLLLLILFPFSLLQILAYPHHTPINKDDDTVHTSFAYA